MSYNERKKAIERYDAEMEAMRKYKIKVEYE